MPAMCGVLAEEPLEADAGEVLLVAGDLDAFLHLDRLVQAVPPGAVGHHAAGELVDDLHGVVLRVDQVLLVAHVAVPRGDGLVTSSSRRRLPFQKPLSVVGEDVELPLARRPSGRCSAPSSRS